MLICVSSIVMSFVSIVSIGVLSVAHVPEPLKLGEP